MRRRRNRAVKRNNIIQATGVIMDSAELKRNLAYADLIRDLAHAREARVKLFDGLFALSNVVKQPDRRVM
jgi:hypothetical protein